MASTQLQTVTEASTITHGRVLCLASARLYAILNDGTNLVYQYSDDDGVTWSSETTIAAGSSLRGSAMYDSVNGRLNICYAGANSTSTALKFRAITSNVTTGTPGALTSETTIDAGGSNLGVQFPYMIHSATVSNPRYWIIAGKFTALSTQETRAWYVNAGTDADTGGNWSSNNFTNLGTNSGSVSIKEGIATYWTVSSADKVTMIFRNDGGGGAQSWEAVTFDPTAATPTPGTVTTVTSSSADHIDGNINGALVAIGSKADYLVFGRVNSTDSNWDFFKTVNGTSWSNPSGWTDLTMGRCQIALSGSDFYLIHTESYGLLTNSAQTLKYRKITASSDTMGGVTTFSDTAGNGVAVPLNTGTSKLYGLYRGSTASPYTVRSDFVSIGGAADTTPTGQATVTATCVGDTAIDVAITMPADIDVSEYEVRFLTGSTYPATNRSDGTVAVSPTATAANASVTFNHTSLTSGTRYAYRVFVKDTAGNWNTGATATAVAATRPTFLARYSAGGALIADGTTPGGNNVILEYQLAAGNFETGGANAFFALRIGTNNATPPTDSTYDLVSTGASQTIFRYEDPASSGVFTNIPDGGLISTFWGRKLRVYTDTTQASQYGSLQVRQ